MAPSDFPELSVVIPVVDELQCISPLLNNLAAQRDCRFEVIFCDGGSRDATAARVREQSDALAFPVRLIATRRGRGRQMNAGAGIARGRFLLFLHADSHFPDNLALRRGLDSIQAAMDESGTDSIAGRFALRFDGGRATEHFGYYFYTCKARLPRRGCIHGDQGFVLPHSIFHRLGGFDEQLPFLEDEKLAEDIFQFGKWLLLPAEIETSARRFEREGLRQRQTLNALIMNFFDIGWHDFLAEAPGIYRSQSHTERLDLAPFFSAVSRMLGRYPFSRRFRLWYATGAYVRSQAWQIPYLLMIRRRFRRRLPPEAGWDVPGRWQVCFDRITDNCFGKLVTACLVRLWFALIGLRFRRAAN